jgi:membrane protein DedA with SNARE-associated domain
MSYLGIFLLMVANGFVSFPSSQILYIIVGYFVGTGYLSFLPASLIGAFGNTIGNILLYETVRRYGIQALQFMQIYKAEEVRKVEVAFQKRGTWFLFVAKLLPQLCRSA